jgi:hypothetical protein
MDVKEDKAILATAKELNSEDVPAPKKRPQKSKCSTKEEEIFSKENNKKIAKKVVDLNGGSSLEGEGSTPTKGQDYEVKTLIVIQERWRKNFQDAPKIKVYVVVGFFFF